MRNNTQQIFERLSRGEFLSVDSSDPTIKYLFNDIEENQDEYAAYFEEIGFRLEIGNGYYFFSRIGESKQSIEQKLDSFAKWLDYLDFFKSYNQSFSAGFQFRKSHLVEQISCDIELKDKARQLSRKYGTDSFQAIVGKLLQELVSIGFAEMISEQDETYKVTSAFRYAEELVNVIQIANEDEIPE